GGFMREETLRPRAGLREAGYGEKARQNPLPHTLEEAGGAVNAKPLPDKTGKGFRADLQTGERLIKRDYDSPRRGAPRGPAGMISLGISPGVAKGSSEPAGGRRRPNARREGGRNCGHSRTSSARQRPIAQEGSAGGAPHFLFLMLEDTLMLGG